jgi:hypothetical protein
MRNTEKNRCKLADKVVDTLILNKEGLDTDLVSEILYDLLMFFYKRISEAEFNKEVKKLGLSSTNMG